MARDKAAPATEGRYRAPEDRTGGPFDDYEVRDALRTLTQANKIRRNKALMKAVRREAQKQLQAAQSATREL